MKKREIPKKNYIILGIIVILVVLLTFYSTAWYKTIKEYNQNNSVMVDVLTKIELESIPSYLLDNASVTIYLASSNDQEIKTFEKKFKKYIAEKNINDEILYLDVNGLTEEEINAVFLNYSASTFKKMKNIVTPNLIYFENGEIIDILYVKKNIIKKNDAVKFLERNNVVTND